MPAEAVTRARFIVRGEASPQLLGRLTGLVAQQGLVPLALTMLRCDDEALVEMEQDGLALERAAVMAEKMRSMVVVRSVDLHYTNTVPEDLSR